MPNIYESNVLIDSILGQAAQGMWEDVNDLVEENPVVAVNKAESGRYLLAEIAQFPGSKETIERLVRLGADVDGTTWNGTRAISNAILGGSRFGANTLDEVKALVEHGASLTAEAESGFPPLHWAIVNCRIDHVRQLLDLGADPLRPSNDTPPETAYDVAKRMKYNEAIDLLNTINHS